MKNQWVDAAHPVLTMKRVFLLATVSRMEQYCLYTTLEADLIVWYLSQ